MILKDDIQKEINLYSQNKHLKDLLQLMFNAIIELEKEVIRLENYKQDIEQE